jgi:two-component system, cell cycle sensor histidine kinase and response regulator CckA
MSRPVTYQVAAEEPPKQTKSVILLVEDDPMVREITRQTLEHAGYQVLEATGPSHALELMAQKKGHVRLLLSDLVMPGMNGLDLSHRLQQLRPDLGTLLMSGYADRDCLPPLSKHSRTIYLQKPFTIDALLSHITEALELIP